MTIDMTFEAREKIIRRDEFAAGQDLLERAISYVQQGMTLEDMIKDEIPEDTAKRALRIMEK